MEGSDEFMAPDCEPPAIAIPAGESRISAMSGKIRDAAERFGEENGAWLMLAILAGFTLYFQERYSADPHQAAMTEVIILAASTLSSVVGFAFSAICGAMLFRVSSDPVRVVEIMITCSIAIQALSVMKLKNVSSRTHLVRFLAGGMLGLPVGLYLLMHLSPHVYLKSIGVLLACYGAYMFCRPVAAVMTKDRPACDLFIGFAGGVAGGFAGLPGAAVTIWCARKGWTKDLQRGVFQPFILIMQILALVSLQVIHASGSSFHAVDLSALTFVPAALLGTLFGLMIFRRLNDRQFGRLINALLIVSGISLAV